MELWRLHAFLIGLKICQGSVFSQALLQMPYFVLSLGLWSLHYSIHTGGPDPLIAGIIGKFCQSTSKSRSHQQPWIHISFSSGDPGMTVGPKIRRCVNCQTGISRPCHPWSTFDIERRDQHSKLSLVWMQINLILQPGSGLLVQQV